MTALPSFASRDSGIRVLASRRLPIMSDSGLSMRWQSVSTSG